MQQPEQGAQLTVRRALRNDRSCAGFWTPASRAVPLAPTAGVQKAPGHEVAGSLAALASGRRYGDLIFTPVKAVGAKLARGGLDRVRRGAWKRAIGDLGGGVKGMNGRLAG